ncbi:MAG TPA: MATE family efflux transporter [Spirochaetia bacterium]
MAKNHDLGAEPIGPLLARFALPSIVGMVVGALYNIVDRIFIGRGVGTLALAGVTVAFPLQLTQIAFSVLIGVGTSALISLSLGEQKREKAEQVLGNGFCLNLVISAVIAGIGIAFLDPFLRLFGASEAVLPYARSFALVVLLGTPFATVSQGINGFIRAEGNPRVAMATQLIGPVLNVFLCPFFIFVLKLGIVGSALATVISQAVGTAWVLAYYLGGNSLLKLRIPNFRPRPSVVGPILAIGSAPALSDFASAVMNGIMNNQLERFGGDLAVTAMGIVFAVSNLVFLTALGIMMGVQPVIGYNFGARLYLRVRKAQLAAVAAATVFVAVVWAVVMAFPGAVVRLFAGDSIDVLPTGVYALRHYFILLPLIGFQILSSGYFQAVGKPLQSLVLSLSRQFIFLVPLLYVLPLFLGLDGLWIAQPVSDALSSLITAVFFVREMMTLSNGAGKPGIGIGAAT